MLEGLAAINRLEIYGPRNPDQQLGVISVLIPGIEPQVLASILDESFGIQTRAGLHCAPGVHRTIGTFEQGGTVRLSVGPFTSPTDIDAAVSALAKIAASG